jgi:hypothetical protein
MARFPRTKRHLAPVHPDAAAPPTFRSTTERIELPTGGRADVDGLLRELVRAAFPKALVGFAAELDPRIGLRCFVTVRTHEGFGPAEVDAARTGIVRALLSVGVLKPAAAASPAPDATPAAGEEGAESPPQAPPSPAQ